MATLGSADAFTKVLQAREELRKIEAELNAACRDGEASSDAAKCQELAKRHARARREFQLAIDSFSATRNGNGR
jgi:hypothetical protein